MKLFKLFSHRRSREKEIYQVETAPTEKKESKRAAKLGTQADRVNCIRDNCDTIGDSNRQVEEAKAEYQAVTSYLTDMQKIDLIPLAQRGVLEKAAGKIISLSKERGKLQYKSTILTDKQYRVFEQYERQLPGELRNIKENEEYKVIIEEDVKQLEKERKKLDREQKEIIGKQSFLKGIAAIISFVVLLLFTLFVMLSNYTDASYTIPFLLTVLMGMASAYYIFNEARKNLAEIQKVQQKQNRQILLMNKVKIKSVNNLNYLEYAYNKYMVSSYEQLKNLWNEYVKVKEEEQKYQKNTDELEQNNQLLINTLKKFDIADAEIWIYQPNAILDNKEMVEVRHRLNVRRQKLRERIDININQKEEAIKEIKKTLKNYPECSEEAETLLRKYRVDIEG